MYLGFFLKNRNPNYLGEMLIYMSFALICNSIIGYTLLVFIWVVVFIPNMLVKDYRLSLKPDF